MNYSVSIRSSDGTPRVAFTVDAATYNQAAQAALVIFRETKTSAARWANRTTGDNDKSGWFQGFQRLGQGATSEGRPFHVS